MIYGCMIICLLIMFVMYYMPTYCVGLRHYCYVRESTSRGYSSPMIEWTRGYSSPMTEWPTVYWYSSLMTEWTCCILAFHSND